MVRPLVRNVLLLAGLTILPSAAAPMGHDLMPAPASLQLQEGRLVLDSAFSLHLAGPADARLKSTAERFVKRLEKRTGLRFASPWAAAPAKAVLRIAIAKPGPSVQSAKEDESYRLVVDGKGVSLTAPNALGALRGLETLLQWTSTAPGAAPADSAAAARPGWAAVKIDDAPRFPWRGLLIDVCRHFHPMDLLKRNLDAMAEAKLNVLHWHLSEDQGFRVESRRYPRLHQMGSDGMYYTQDQIRELVAYARDRGIRVMPEFDIPGHATSWLVGHPELAAGKGPYAIERRFGIFNPTLDPTRDTVYAFLDNFLGEMAGLFPDAYMHIGGDEVTGREWNENPDIQAFMNRKGLKTHADLQTYFNARLAKILAKHGKKMAGWDEIAHPDLPKNVLVQNWRGTEGLARGAREGRDGILSNGYYLDLMHPAASHYAMDPLPPPAKPEDALDAKAKAHVLGGEACMWSEYTSSETIESRLWPRLMAVAERLWSPAEVKDVEEMYRRMPIASVRLEDHGLIHRSQYRPMLARLLGVEPGSPQVDAFQTLADAVAPVRAYARSQSRQYTSLTPLNRFVDAVRPESEAGRRFNAGVEAFLGTAVTGSIPGAAGTSPGPAAAQTPNPYQAHPIDSLRAALLKWKANHAVLGPLLLKAPEAQEVHPQSVDLAEAAQVALEALESIASGRQAAPEWRRKALKTLARAGKPRAEVEIAMVPGARKLVLAAGHWNTLKAQAALERAAALKALADAPISHDGH
jgi:hexosaminidase